MSLFTVLKNKKYIMEMHANIANMMVAVLIVSGLSD